MVWLALPFQFFSSLRQMHMLVLQIFNFFFIAAAVFSAMHKNKIKLTVHRSPANFWKLLGFMSDFTGFTTQQEDWKPIMSPVATINFSTGRAAVAHGRLRNLWSQTKFFNSLKWSRDYFLILEIHLYYKVNFLKFFFVVQLN